MADGAVRDVDPDKQFCAVGVFKIDGFADGEGVIVDQEGNRYDDVVGIDGEVTRIKKKDKRATITIRLHEGSPANLILSKICKLDEAGLGVGPFLAKGAGSSVYSGAKCWISKEPRAVPVSDGVQVKEWTLRVAKLVRLDGFIPEA